MIQKFGLVVVRNGKLLLCRPHAYNDLIMPGGIIEGNETPLDNLTREVREELGNDCTLDPSTLGYLGEFSDVAAGKPGRVVRIQLYSGMLIGDVYPSSEIKELVWYSTDMDELLSPVVENKIVPFLIKKGLID